MGTCTFNSVEKGIIHYINTVDVTKKEFKYDGKKYRFTSDFDAYIQLKEIFEADGVYYSSDMNCKVYHDIWALTLSILEMEHVI